SPGLPAAGERSPSNPSSRSTSDALLPPSPSHDRRTHSSLPPPSSFTDPYHRHTHSSPPLSSSFLPLPDLCVGRRARGAAVAETLRWRRRAAKRRRSGARRQKRERLLQAPIWGFGSRALTASPSTTPGASWGSSSPRPTTSRR
uniref:Uncharacterized protein n=4 Tax=Aegilops tauschii subsp. strangulata TaxID=200361 RepID=A0A453JWR8_AEGTS